MTPDRHDEAGFLTLRVGGSPGQGERLLLIQPPNAGLVTVRQWTSNSPNTEGQDLVLTAGELLADVERAYAARWLVSEEIGRVRRWLQG